MREKEKGQEKEQKKEQEKEKEQEQEQEEGQEQMCLRWLLSVCVCKRGEVVCV